MESRAMTPTVHLHQIAYSAKTLADIEPGYAVIDNVANPRPDWFEVWPIRQFLMETPLDDSAFYGFFSTKFGKKTQLLHTDVTHFVQQHAGQAEVMLFSPQPDMGAFYLNVFEQGDLRHRFDPDAGKFLGQHRPAAGGGRLGHGLAADRFF